MLRDGITLQITLPLKAFFAFSIQAPLPYQVTDCTQALYHCMLDPNQDIS